MILFPLPFSLSSIALSVREHSITCAPRVPLGNSGVRRPLKQHMFIDGLHIHNPRLCSPFSILFPAYPQVLRGRPPPRSSTADPVLLQWEWKDGEKAPPSSLDLSSVLFCPRRTDGQRPSLFFLLNSAPSPTDRQEKGGGETDRPKQQPVSLFRRSRAPATLARILSFSSASAAPPCPPTYGAVCRQQAIKEASAGGSGSARAPVSNA